jgi:hypothetical protein
MNPILQLEHLAGHFQKEKFTTAPQTMLVDIQEHGITVIHLRTSDYIYQYSYVPSVDSLSLLSQHGLTNGKGNS